MSLPAGTTSTGTRIVEAAENVVSSIIQAETVAAICEIVGFLVFGFIKMILNFLLP